MDSKKIIETIKRGAEEIISEEELTKKLKQNKPLIIKAGFDPTAPDLHLGHTVLLRKMKQFQDLGHRVVFLIGDFTAMIGDPSGKSKIRKKLLKQDVDKNAKIYASQIKKILDQTKISVIFNSQWHQNSHLTSFLELSSHYTVARILERNDFSKRFKNNQPISIIEMLYPLIQAWDSIHLKADVELGGTDQKFNLLVGRQLQKEYQQKPQIIITVPILEGLDGVEKMSKSLGNSIGIFETPKEMYGKLMSIPDTLIFRYFELLTDVSYKIINHYKQKIDTGENPKNIKIILAKTIVSMYHSKEKAEIAEKEFKTIFSNKGLPNEIPTIKINEKKINIISLIEKTKIYESKNQIRRLIKEGGVSINQEKILNEMTQITLEKELILKIGKRKFYKITT